MFNYNLRFPFPFFFFFIVIVFSSSRACFISFFLDRHCFFLNLTFLGLGRVFFLYFLKPFFYKFPPLKASCWQGRTEKHKREGGEGLSTPPPLYAWYGCLDGSKI